MTPDDRWQRLKQMFLDALEQPRARRSAWLAEQHGDEALYSEVRALLDAHDSDPAFLEDGARIDPADLAEIDARAKSPLVPGTILGDGRYRILGEAGRGGMAVVYVADDLRLSRRVALKSLPPESMRDPSRLERFRREAWAAARISHPAVATIYAFEELDDHPFIAYEPVRGRTLREALADGPLEPAVARRVAIDIARALAAAHEQGVVHRDLKPENVMLTSEGGVKVLDFGIAQVETGSLPALTQEGSWLGTPAYMAPEQKAGAPVDARADIYAFGIVLVELLTGRHPLAATPAPRQRGSEPSGPAAIEAAGVFTTIVRRCLQLEPAARYGSARELLQALDAAPVSSDGGGAVPPGSPRRWWEFHQGATTVLYALLAAAAWEAWHEMLGVSALPTPGRRLATAVLVSIVVPAIIAAALRLNLWFAARLLPDQLGELRRRRRAWIHASEWVLIAALVSGGLLILDRFPNRGLILLAGAAGLAVAAALIEPVTERAVFGSAVRP